MKNRIFRVIVPAVLSGIALALALGRVWISGSTGVSAQMAGMPVTAVLARLFLSGSGGSVIQLMTVPAAAALLLAHGVWERPRTGRYLLLGLPLLLLELGALSGLPLLSRQARNFWNSVQAYFATPYMFNQYKSFWVVLDICLIAAYGSMLILIVEAFIGKDFLSRAVSFVTAAGFIAYAVYYAINYRMNALAFACGYLPHILICIAAALLCLRKAEPPRVSEAPGPEGGPDYETRREMLLELMRMRRDGALSEAAYAEKAGRLLEKP